MCILGGGMLPEENEFITHGLMKLEMLLILVKDSTIFFLCILGYVCEKKSLIIILRAQQRVFSVFLHLVSHQESVL